MNYQDRIVRDPQIVGGEPILQGTRVTLKTVRASLAEGATTTEILADFPTLSEGGRPGGHRVRRWLRAGKLHASDRNTDQTVKIKLDENLPDRLVSVLTELAHDVDTVRGEQLTGRADPDRAECGASRSALPDHTRSRFFGCPPVYARHSRRSPSCAPFATRS